MPGPSFLVLVREREPYWTPELQRQMLGETGVAVRHCSTWPALDAADAAHAVLVLNLQDDLGGALAWLRRQRQNPRHPVIAVATPSLAAWEWTFRSLGVTSFITEIVTGRELARQCRQWRNEPRTP